MLKKLAVLVTTAMVITSHLTASPTNIFVNNTNPMSGDGSFGNPYNTLLAAQTASNVGDAIFVSVGDGTSTGMNAGIVLKNNQSLIGIGLPLITNASGNGVELADNNVVSGLHIDSTGAWGIHGANINTTNLSANLITNPLTQGGIGIFDGTATLNIVNSTIKNGNSSENGIQINNTGSTAATVVIKTNVISNFFEGIVVFGFDNSAITSKIIQNDVSSTSSIGIDIDAFDFSQSSTTIKSNTVHDNTQNGIVTFSGNTNAFLEATIQKNSITNSGLEGLVVATGNGGKQSAHVLGNTLSGNGGVAGMIAETSLTATPGDVLCLQLHNNHSTTGYYLENFVGSTFNLEPLTGNVGTLTTAGTITPVPTGFCQ